VERAITAFPTRPAPGLITRIALVVIATLAWPEARLGSQSVSIVAENGAVGVRAPGFRFIDGEPLIRLKNGQSVRVELELSVLSEPGGAATTRRRQPFVLSYDLWEERFAVAITGTPPRSVSHLSPTAAEAWCLQQLAVPVTALGNLGRSLPFWIRLDYRVVNGSTSPDRDDEGFTLRGLIEVLSRRQTGEVSRSIEAGPFHLPK
jgi:hypothetical protein